MIPIDLKQRLFPKNEFVMLSILQSRFHDHFRTGEIWDDLVIKFLLSHCIHQHTDFSKGVLVLSSDSSQDY